MPSQRDHAPTLRGHAAMPDRPSGGVSSISTVCGHGVRPARRSQRTRRCRRTCRHARTPSLRKRRDRDTRWQVAARAANNCAAPGSSRNASISCASSNTLPRVLVRSLSANQRRPVSASWSTTASTPWALSMSTVDAAGEFEGDRAPTSQQHIESAEGHLDAPMQSIESPCRHAQIQACEGEEHHNCSDDPPVGSVHDCSAFPGPLSVPSNRASPLRRAKRPTNWPRRSTRTGSPGMTTLS